MNKAMNTKTYFFCGIGGSGMSALAQYLCRCGANVFGSDRSFDQGQNASVCNALQKQGITIVNQNGRGVTSNVDVLIVSSAIEPTISDVAAAQKLNIPITTRAELLAEIFQSFPRRIAVAGTSGKSTVTAMIGHILTVAGKDPTVINGAAMAPDISDPGIGNVRTGNSDLCVIEADESDGSIANYTPTLSVLTNMGLDHKSMPELRQLFGDFLTRATAGAVINRDCAESMQLAHPAHTTTFSMCDSSADLYTSAVQPAPQGMAYPLQEKTYTLPMPGEHNIANALAAIAGASILGIAINEAATALQSFGGVRRRLETIGCSSNGVRVMDDFAHNPDKVTASLNALKSQQGRLRVFFQPHGYAPLRLFLDPLSEAFSGGLSHDDLLVVSPVYYAGGTVASREVTSEDLVNAVRARGANARLATDRKEALAWLCDGIAPGDCIVVMGARDDTLTDFCHHIHAHLNRNEKSNA